MFTSLELGRDEAELQAGGLSLKKNPLLVSIVDGCETLKALVMKAKLRPEDVAGCKGLILMRTDKVRAAEEAVAWCSRQAHRRRAGRRTAAAAAVPLAAAARRSPLPERDATALTCCCWLQIGFGISVTQGYGLILTRLPNTPSGWCAAGARARCAACGWLRSQPAVAGGGRHVRSSSSCCCMRAEVPLLACSRRGLHRAARPPAPCVPRLHAGLRRCRSRWMASPWAP